MNEQSKKANTVHALVKGSDEAIAQWRRDIRARDAAAREADALRPDRSTYIRKIDCGKFEYGFVERARNFRKNSDIFDAAGVCASVAEAEAARAQLIPVLARSRRAIS